VDLIWAQVDQVMDPDQADLAWDRAWEDLIWVQADLVVEQVLVAQDQVGGPPPGVPELPII
jgi:hypothetical protein